MSAVLQLAAIPHCYYSYSFKSNRRSGSKKDLLPNEKSLKPKIGDTRTTLLQLAQARGHRWLDILETGKANSFKGIAERKTLITVTLVECST